MSNRVGAPGPEVEERLSPSHSRDTDEDDYKRLLQARFLPLDLALRIISHLPSAVLFNFRRLCKAAFPLALRILAHRSFFVLQKNSPSSLCFLLPADSPCLPLPCSFNIAKPSFRLVFSSRNFLCFQRRYPLLLDVCICNIFWKWKIVIPPIVHPHLAPRLQRRVFFEDANVEYLNVVGFHAVGQNADEEAHSDHALSPEFRVFVASSTYLRVFDSQLNRWLGPVYFPSYLLTQSSHQHPLLMKPPACFTTSDGNLLLSFSYRSRTLFMYEDQSFRAMELDFHPTLEVGGYLARAVVEDGFNLVIRLPHVEECVRSSRKQGLVLKGECEPDGDAPVRNCQITVRGVTHNHRYVRVLERGICHSHQNKVYVLVMERSRWCCDVIEQDWLHMPFEVCEDMLERPLLDEVISLRSECTGAPVSHDTPSADVEKCLSPEKNVGLDCKNLSVTSPSKLTLYIACIDLTDWTMKVSMEADASAFLDAFNQEGGKLSFVSG